MKLITKALEKTFAKYPLYSQDGKGNDAVAIAKFFLPGSGFTWYVTEAWLLHTVAASKRARSLWLAR